MKLYIGKAKIIVGIFLLFVSMAAGCQTANMGVVGKSVTTGERLALNATGFSGATWGTRDLDVRYTLAMEQGTAKLSGAVRMSDVITGNFSIIDYFHMDVLFLDNQGKVISMKGLVSTARSRPSETLEFSVPVRIPAGAVSMAFSYRGQAIDTGPGGGSPSYFWHYPVN